MTATRWHVKKAARYALVVSEAVRASLSFGRGPARKPRVRVLTYHRFRTSRHDPFSVDIGQFERQMCWLAEQRLAISLADLDEFLAGRREIRDGAVLVTIDDGYREIWSSALPILRRYSIPAVAFVSSADMTTEGPAGDRSSNQDCDARLTPSELSALPAGSVEVGSHSWQHRSLGRMTAEEAGRQIRKSKTDLEALLGRPVTAFAYPFGTWKDFNATTTALLTNAGFRFGFTSQHGSISANAEPYSLPRIKVEGGEGLWMFKRLVSGALDSWWLVDRSLWWLQQSDGLTQL